jgi:hypothetical protein
MKRYFSNIAVDCWYRSPARLGATLNCLCLQADSTACDIFLYAVQELKSEGAPSQRKLTLSGRKFQHSCSVMRLVVSPESEQLKQMDFRREGETAVLEFTMNGLEEFRKAIEALKGGAQDFCISPDFSRFKKKVRGTDDQELLELWFWTPFMDP